MNVPSSTHRRRLTRTLLAALTAIIGVLLLGGIWASASPATSAAAAVTARHHNGPKPTIVLVHGAFADASGWAGVITRLEERGYIQLYKEFRGRKPHTTAMPTDAGRAAFHDYLAALERIIKAARA